MPSYSLTIKRGDHVVHYVENVPLLDPAEAWCLIDDLASRFDGQGLRVIVKDEDGNVVIMAGLVSANVSRAQTAA